MPWVTVPEAVGALNISTRTLTRRITSEQYPTKYERGKKLIYLTLDDANNPTAQVVGVAKSLGEVAAAAAVQSQRDAETVGRVTKMAESAQRLAWRAVVSCLATVLLVIGVGVVYSGWTTQKHASERDSLVAKVADAGSQLAAHSGHVAAITSLYDAERERADRIDLERIEARRDAEDAEIEIVRLQDRIEAADRSLEWLGLTSELVAGR